MIGPLVPDTAGFVEPAAPLSYLVAANGVFQVRRTALFTAVTGARAVPGLRPRTPSLQLSIRPVPRLVLERVYGFFDAVFRRWDGEAVALLFYAPEAGRFRIGIPPQQFVRHRAGGRRGPPREVAYGYVPRPEGFVKLGDAHSHCELPAFFSCTDDRDDAEDGLRITLGRLDRRRPDVAVSFVASGQRFRVRPAAVLEEFSRPLTPPRAWLERVRCRAADSEEPGRARTGRS